MIYINGEIGEVTEFSGKLNLRQFTSLRCVKFVKNPGNLSETTMMDTQPKQNHEEYEDKEMRDESQPDEEQKERPMSTWVSALEPT